MSGVATAAGGTTTRRGSRRNHGAAGAGRRRAAAGGRGGATAAAAGVGAVALGEVGLVLLEGGGETGDEVLGDGLGLLWNLRHDSVDEGLGVGRQALGLLQDDAAEAGLLEGSLLARQVVDEGLGVALQALHRRLQRDGVGEGQRVGALHGAGACLNGVRQVAGCGRQGAGVAAEARGRVVEGRQLGGDVADHTLDGGQVTLEEDSGEVGGAYARGQGGEGE